MSAGKLNIEIEKKATFRKVLTLFSAYFGEGSSENVPLNITGATIEAAIKVTVNDVSPAAVFDVTLISGTNGQFSISMSPADTEALSISKGVYDVLVTLSDGTALRVIEGSVFVTKGVA